MAGRSSHRAFVQAHVCAAVGSLVDEERSATWPVGSRGRRVYAAQVGGRQFGRPRSGREADGPLGLCVTSRVAACSR